MKLHLVVCKLTNVEVLIALEAVVVLNCRYLWEYSLNGVSFDTAKVGSYCPNGLPNINDGDKSLLAV